jgi:hypothetical protein
VDRRVSARHGKRCAVGDFHRLLLSANHRVLLWDRTMILGLPSAKRNATGRLPAG